MKSENNGVKPGGTEAANWLHWFTLVYLGLGIAIIVRYAPMVAEYLFAATSTTPNVAEENGGPVHNEASHAVARPNDEAQPEVIKPQTLQALVEEFADSQQAEFHIYAKNLKTGETAEIRPHEPVPSGSIYKMFLADYVYKQNQAGQVDMGMAAGFGGYSMHTCTMLMVRDSSNDCGEAVRATLGADKITKHLHKSGYKNTNVAKAPAAVTSAYDLALILERVYKGGYFRKDHNAEFEGYLRDQMWTFRIPEGIPREPAGKGLTGTRNKTGDVYGFANDGAIVLGENTDYILVVMSNGWPRVFPDSSYSIRHLSGLVYNYMNGTDYELIY